MSESEKIKYQSKLREQAIAAGMPEDMSAMSPPPKMSSIAPPAASKAVSRDVMDEARRLADIKIAKSHMAQIEAQRQQRIEKQQREMLEAVKKEIAQRRVDRAERQFQIAKDVYNRGGDAQELSDRFRLDLLGELRDSFWDGTPEEREYLKSLEQKANGNADSGVWGYSPDKLNAMSAKKNIENERNGFCGYSASDLTDMKLKEASERAAANNKSNWDNQYADVAEKMRTSVNTPSVGFRQRSSAEYNAIEKDPQEKRKAATLKAYRRYLKGESIPGDEQYAWDFQYLTPYDAGKLYDEIPIREEQKQDDIEAEKWFLGGSQYFVKNDATKKTATINYDGYNIDYTLRPYTIDLPIKDQDILILLSKNPQSAYDIARQLKEKYREHFGADLNVDENSLAAEILGHYVFYANGFFKNSTKDANMGSAIKLEQGKYGVNDNNRLVWDLSKDYFLNLVKLFNFLNNK